MYSLQKKISDICVKRRLLYKNIYITFLLFSTWEVTD